MCANLTKDNYLLKTILEKYSKFSGNDNESDRDSHSDCESDDNWMKRYMPVRDKRTLWEIYRSYLLQDEQLDMLIKYRQKYPTSLKIEKIWTYHEIWKTYKVEYASLNEEVQHTLEQIYNGLFNFYTNIKFSLESEVKKIEMMEYNKLLTRTFQNLFSTNFLREFYSGVKNRCDGLRYPSWADVSETKREKIRYTYNLKKHICNEIKKSQEIGEVVGVYCIFNKNSQFRDIDPKGLISIVNSFLGQKKVLDRHL